MHFFTDASSTVGFGGFYEGKWFCDIWPKDLPSISDKVLSMAFLELYPIVVAAVLWGKNWCGKRILFYCDNLATVKILTKGRSREPTIMKLMRRLVMCAAHFNFAIYSEHLPGKINLIADSLSRLQMEKFHQLAPDAEPTATPCPSLDKIIWMSQ